MPNFVVLRFAETFNRVFVEKHLISSILHTARFEN